MTAHILIDALESGAAWANLPMAEQIAMRAIARRLAAMAKDGTTAEDWQQLAGYAEWARKPDTTSAAPMTISGQWTQWLGGNDHPRGDTRVEVEFRGNSALWQGRAGHVVWVRDGHPGEVLRYRVID